MSFEEERPVLEFLASMLENPGLRLEIEHVYRIFETLLKSSVPSQLEEVIPRLVSLREELVTEVVAARLKNMLSVQDLEGCSSFGIDAEVCRFMHRLIKAYKYLFTGLLITDKAGNLYVMLLRDRVVGGRLLRKGSVVSLPLSEALLLYAIGDARLASIKPLKE